MKRWTRIISIFFLLSVFGVILALRSDAVSSRLITVAQEIFHLETGFHLQIEKAQLEPLGLRITVQKFRIVSPENMELVTARAASISLKFFPLLLGKVSIDDIIVWSPKAHIDLLQWQELTLPEKTQGTGGIFELGTVYIHDAALAVEGNNALQLSLQNIEVMAHEATQKSRNVEVQVGKHEECLSSAR